MRIAPLAVAGILAFSIPIFAEHDDHVIASIVNIPAPLRYRGRGNITAIHTSTTKDGIFRTIMDILTTRTSTAFAGLVMTRGATTNTIALKMRGSMVDGKAAMGENIYGI
ncbi:MAG: hypothetical protein JST28_10770 [Acidobacteria bacterium]|nr:hypothetical protein [Acidobacteriota bacterium]